MKKQEETINWFGEPKNKKKVNVNLNSINYLGLGIKSNLNKSTNSNKSNTFSFLGINANTKRERVIKKRKHTNTNSQGISFLGQKNNNYKMTPSTLFRKESIKQKKLSKYGDADMDGSPNWFDCDPRNAFKDAKSLTSEKILEDTRKKMNERSLKAQTIRGAFKQISEDKRIDRERKKRKSLDKGIPFRKTYKESASTLKQKMRMVIPGLATDEGIIKQYESQPSFGKLGTAIKERTSIKKGYSPLEETKRQAIEQIEERKIQKEKYTPLLEAETKKEREYGDIVKNAENQIKFIDKKLEDESISEVEYNNLAKQRDIEFKKYSTNLPLFEKAQVEKEKYSTEIQNINVREAAGEKQAEKISTAETQTGRIKELLNKPGMAGTLGAAQYAVDVKHAAGKQPSAKELKNLAKIERRIRKIGDIQQEGKLSREVLTRIPGGEIGRVLTGAAVDKSGQYSGALKAKSAKIRRMTGFAAGAIFGNIGGTRSFDSEPRGRGRPPGASGEYRIGGKPVYEAEFQQYASKQAALNRLLPSGQQSQTLNPEYIAYMKAKAAEDRGETQTVMTEEGMPMEGTVSGAGDSGLPSMGTSMMQTGEQQVQLQQKRAYVRATPDEIKIAQAQAQAMDNPLSAPNFMKGELKATGGNILTPIGPSILEAPQVFKGEMRNVTKTNPEEGEIKLGERPQTNPYGDEWLDIEVGSGKPVLRKRIKEKWMTGEAL
jgi:hypothetical protein